MIARLLKLASILSLLLCIATAWLLVQSLGTEITWGFARHGTQWEIACRSGKLGIDNDPEIWEAARPQREREAIRETFQTSQWGSAEYNNALAQVKAMDNAPAIPPVVVPRIEYAVRLELLIALEMLLPLIWLVCRRRRANRKPAGPVARGLFTISAVLSLSLCVPVVVFWVRSYSRVENINRFSISQSGIERVDTIGSRHGSAYLWHNYGTIMSGPFAVGTKWIAHQILSPRPTFALYLNNPLTAFSNPAITECRQWEYHLGGFAIGGHRTIENAQQHAGPPLATFQFTGAIIPYWLIMVLLLTMPTIWAWKLFRRAMLKAAGHCVKCGYDLTGNTSGVCPECGTTTAGS